MENVDELIERQEKSLLQLETKRGVVKELIEKGKQILVNPDKPKFLEGHVQVQGVQEKVNKSKEFHQHIAIFPSPALDYH